MNIFTQVIGFAYAILGAAWLVALVWFFWKWAHYKPKVMAASLSVPIPYTRLTLAEWKSSQERVAYARELLRTPLFLELVGMLANLRPSYGGVQDGTHAALLLGQQAGHDTVIATLLAAGSGDAPSPATLEADYMAKNVMQGWDDGREA